MSAVPEPAWIPHSDVERLREARDILRDEGQALIDMSRRLDAGFCAAVEALKSCRGTLVVTGMGKAGHIGRKLAATFSSTGTKALFLHPAEAVHGDLGAVSSEDVVLALSHSGETDELNRLLPALKRVGVTIIAITSRETSTLGHTADFTIAMGSLREAGQWGLAPTTSTTVMLAIGDALALVVSRERGFTRQQFAFNHPAGALGRKLCRVSEVMRCRDQLRVALASTTVRDVFVNMGKPGRRTGAVILVDEAGVLNGLFTDSDLVRLLEMRRESQVDRPIAEVMTANPRTIRPDALLGDAVELLARYHISELPVVDEAGHPVGLIDITDVIGMVPEIG
jgi:arabinose-5-phosphate isomerase